MGVCMVAVLGPRAWAPAVLLAKVASVTRQEEKVEFNINFVRSLW